MFHVMHGSSRKQRCGTSSAWCGGTRGRVADWRNSMQRTQTSVAAAAANSGGAVALLCTAGGCCQKALLTHWHPDHAACFPSSSLNMFLSHALFPLAPQPFPFYPLFCLSRCSCPSWGSLAAQPATACICPCKPPKNCTQCIPYSGRALTGHQQAGQGTTPLYVTLLCK